MLQMMCSLGLLFPLAVDDKPAKPAARRLAETTLQIVDTVLDHHVDSSSRQELVLQVRKSLHARFDTPSPRRLAKRVSEATEQQLVVILEEAYRLATAKGEPDQERFDSILRNALANLPFPIAVTTSENAKVNKQVAENRYVGTGIRLAMQPRPVMVQVFEDGPAWKAGAVDGDVITSIDGETTDGLKILDVIRKLRGPAGSEVEVTLRQPKSDESRTYTITRGVVPLRTIEKPTFDDARTIAYLKFTSIGGSAVHELRKIEASLPATVEHVVFDFRNLFNQHLHHATLLANALLDEKPLGSVTDSQGTRKVASEPGRMFDQRHLTVLINGGTAGTPEWIAAALSANGRAFLAGQTTAGAGYIMEPRPVGDRLSVDVVVGYLTSSGGRQLIRKQLVQRLPHPGPGEPATFANAKPQPQQGGVVPQFSMKDGHNGAHFARFRELAAAARRLKPLAQPK